MRYSVCTIKDGKTKFKIIESNLDITNFKTKVISNLEKDEKLKYIKEVKNANSELL